MTYNFNLMH